MKFLSWNVNGLRSVYRHNFSNFLKDQQPDVLAVQEIKARRQDLPPDILHPPQYHFYMHAAQRPGYSGTAIYSRQKASRIITRLGHRRFDNEGRLLALEFANYIFASLYLPHGKRDKGDLDYKLTAYKLLEKKVFLWRQRKPVILGGDFNVAKEEIDLARPPAKPKKHYVYPQ